MVGKSFKTLTTARLLIRELRPDDQQAMQRIGAHPSMASVLASVTSPWAKDAIKTWIARSLFHGCPGFYVAVFCRRLV